jgi:hypothetical protein
VGFGCRLLAIEILASDGACIGGYISGLRSALDPGTSPFSHVIVRRYATTVYTSALGEMADLALGEQGAIVGMRHFKKLMTDPGVNSNGGQYGSAVLSLNKGGFETCAKIEKTNW